MLFFPAIFSDPDPCVSFLTVSFYDFKNSQVNDCQILGPALTTAR